MAPGDDRIRRYYVFRAVTNFSLWIPFWTLWAYENLQDYFLLTLVDVGFWVTMIVFQIPAGLLGDKYGRKTVLFAGELLWAAGILAFGLSSEVWSLLAANVVWATGVCFIVSGESPFVYDTLLELNRQREFISIMAKGWAVASVMNAAACVIGGIMVEYTEPARLDLTLIISSFISMLGSMTVLTLKEPRVDRSRMKSYTTHLRDGFRRVLTTKAILILIMFQIVIEIAIYVMAVFRSVYMNEDLRLGYLEIGAFIGAFTLFGGFAASQAGKIEGALGEKRSLLFLYLTVLGSFAVVFLVSSPVAILVQFPIYAVSYLQGPIISGYINKRVDSEHRSTIVAIASLMFTAFLTAVELPAGLVANEVGTRPTMMLLALAITPVALMLLYHWGREVDASKRTKKVRALKRF